MTEYAFPEVAPEIEITRQLGGKLREVVTREAQDCRVPLEVGAETAWAYYKGPEFRLDIGNIGWVAGKRRPYRKQERLEVMERAVTGQTWGSWRRLWYAVSPEQVQRLFLEDSFYVEGENIVYSRWREDGDLEPRVWRPGKSWSAAPLEDWEFTEHWAVDGPFVVRSGAARVGLSSRKQLEHFRRSRPRVAWCAVGVLRGRERPHVAGARVLKQEHEADFQEP